MYVRNKRGMNFVRFITCQPVSQEVLEKLIVANYGDSGSQPANRRNGGRRQLFGTVCFKDLPVVRGE